MVITGVVALQGFTISDHSAAIMEVVTINGCGTKMCVKQKQLSSTCLNYGLSSFSRVAAAATARPVNHLSVM